MAAWTSLAKSGSGNGSIAELGFVCLRERDALADLPARHLRWFDHRDGPMVLLHDNFNARLHLLQNGVRVFGEFGFCDADGHPVFDHSC